jgi:uncharacterized protein (UPF0332 family)
MSATDFLRKLKEEGKLKITFPNDDIAASYMEKSSKSLLSSKTLQEIGNLEDSIALSYYAMYHALTALMFKTGVKCENHAASILLLREVFGKDNHEIARAKKERVDKQYYVDFSVTENETKEAIERAEDFISNLKEFIDTLSRKDAEHFNAKAKSLISG